MPLQISSENVSLLETQHCVTKPRSLPSGNEAKSQIVIPIPMSSLADIVVIEPVLEIKPGQLFVQGIVWPEVTGVVPGGNIGEMLSQFP